MRALCRLHLQKDTNTEQVTECTVQFAENIKVSIFSVLKMNVSHAHPCKGRESEGSFGNLRTQRDDCECQGLESFHVIPRG